MKTKCFTKLKDVEKFKIKSTYSLNLTFKLYKYYKRKDFLYETMRVVKFKFQYKIHKTIRKYISGDTVRWILRTNISRRFIENS